MEEKLLLFLDYLKNEKHYSPHTIEAYRGDIEQFLAFVEAKKVRRLSRRHVRQYLEEMGQTCSRVTLARKLSSLRSFYRYLVKRHGLQENPFESLHSPKLDKKVPHWLSTEELQSLLEQPNTENFQGLRDRTILEVLYGCGLRASEVTGLDTADVHLRSHYLFVRGKGRKERLVPLSEPTHYWLSQYLEARPSVQSRALFLGVRTQRRLSSRTIQQIVKKYALQAGLSPLPTPHTLRHTCASHLLQAGLSLREVQEFLGHESIAATQIYTHLGSRELLQLYRSFHPRS